MSRIVSIIHAPTGDKPYDRTYTIRYLGNIADGKPVCHLNLHMDDFKKAIIDQLQDGKVVLNAEAKDSGGNAPSFGKPNMDLPAFELPVVQ